MIKRLEVDGVPAVLAPASGPMHAGLVFRVGTADEPLARHGLTRLVEHLVTDGLGVDGQQLGSTGAEHTYFHMHGSPGEVADFLTGVCAALRNPPAARLATVRQLLRGTPPDRDPLPMWRHGARGFGVASYPEWALGKLTEEDLREWIARYFTRENAALWVAGEEIPDGLTLDLPSGERRPAPAVPTELPVTPAYFTSAGGAVAWDTVVRREARAAVFATVLERRMMNDLRRRDGISYQPHTEYVPRADGTARILAVADALPERQDAAVGGLIDVLAAMRAGQIDPDEVATVVKLTCEGLRDSELRGARLPGQAFNLLSGREVQSLEEALAEVRSVTVEDVTEVAAAAYQAGLLMTPTGSGADWAGYTAAPEMSENTLPGRAHRGRKDRSLRLISGDDGISVTGHGQVASVRWDECALLLAWPDGGRRMIGLDAVTARVEPTLYRGADRVVREIDARIPARLRIDMPPRDRAAIPQPVAPHREGTWRERWRPQLFLLLFGPFTLLGLTGVVSVLTALGNDGRLDWQALLAGLGLTAFFGWLCVGAIRELLARRAARRR
ncbi:insulinase family protein [Actinoplanes sp. NPDC049802]|uniref:M16 family metallopeptidase n=1 Tax=Actinoplanes sp. NPDC049802 TaxID=3154742 RepID=UPI003400B8FA